MLLMRVFKQKSDNAGSHEILVSTVVRAWSRSAVRQPFSQRRGHAVSNSPQNISDDKRAWGRRREKEKVSRPRALATILAAHSLATNRNE